MTSDHGIHVGKPPFFDGNNYDYWKTRMSAHLKAMSRKLWRVVNDGYVILDPKSLTPLDEENEILNDQGVNVLFSALDVNEFNRVKSLTNANDIWKKLMEIHEGTSTVKEAKLYLLKGNFSEFTMKKDESIAEMFNRLNDIVNDLKGLGFEVPDGDFNHKFLRCLPERYDTIVTLLVRSNVKTATPTQILGEILTHDMFKKSQDEAHGGEIDMKKKSVAFKAQDSKNEEESGCQEEESDEEMALFVKRFNRMMSKKNFGKRGQSSRKNPFVDKTCFNCGEVGHIIVNCPNKKKDKKNDEKKKKKFIKKKKNGQAYFVEWDSDASSDDYDDDDKPSKGVAGIAIKEAPSLFSTPHCLMAKGGAKVQQDGELDELSYDDLVEMLNDADEFMTKEKAKLRDLKLKFTSLQDSYEELKTSHENLKETHEKLEEAHNTLLNHERKATLSIGVSCDLIDDKSCGSSSTSSLCTKIDNSSCNKSLIMENDLLKKEVTCLTNDLRKCYDSRAKFNHCWASQKFTLNKQGFGYIPKKGKKAFVQTKTTFVKSSGKPYCEKCKKVGHVEKNCTNKKVISFDSSYMLMKNSNGNVSAKFVGIPINGAKKNAIWVPKVLVTNVVTNVQGPKKVWVPKKVTSSL